MAAIALLFAADLPAANAAGRVFNLTMLLWCGAFIAWFWTHPRTDEAPPASGSTTAAERAEEADLRTAAVLELGSARRAALDPVEQARRRFRIRDDEPAPRPSEERRS